MHYTTRATFVALTLVALAACDAPKTDGAAASSEPKASNAAPSGSTTPAAAPAPKPVEMVDHDLGAADAKWAGWTAKGPADAKVMQDGVQGARIAGKGPNIMERKPGGDEGFDIAFAWGKDDIKTHRANVEKGVKADGGTFTVLKEEDGLIEYSLKGAKTGETSYYFIMHMNVEKTDVTCKNGNMMGAGNEAQHKGFIEACKTLAKKK